MEDRHLPEQNREPLFVVGMWRSGTSLFYALLNQHPQIKLMYEDELPLLWPLFVGSHAKRDWPERWEFWNQALSRHKINIEDLPRDVSSLRQACEAAWSLYAGDVEIRGGKSPSYFDCLPRIAKEFPGTKFIFLWRNPTDICRSVARAQSNSFFSKRGMVLRALLGCRDLKRGYDTLTRHGIKTHSVHYEELVKDPTQVMHGVCAFLHIEFDPHMVTLKNADRSAIYEGSHHKMVNGEAIVADKEKAEVLPADIRRKVDRYIAHWKRESSSEWPRYPEITPDSSLNWLFPVTRIADSALYRGLRTFDGLVAMVYSYFPMFLLRKYRASKPIGAEQVSSPKQIGEGELVGASHKH